MRVRQALLGTVLVALAFAGSASAQEGDVTVAADREEIRAPLGGDFSFRTRIANTGSTESEPLVAHLNILSLDGRSYVDPEDWSGARTRYLGAIPAASSVSVTWGLKAVGSGSLAAYVTVLPQDEPSGRPATSEAIRIAIAERRALTAGGILPIAIGVPGLVGLLAGGIRLSRRGWRPKRAAARK